MEAQIHGHDVLDFMIASGVTYTRNTLVQAMHTQFGPEACYRTCAADGMNASQLIEFLAARGKFRGGEEGFEVATEKVCQH